MTEEAQTEMNAEVSAESDLQKRKAMEIMTETLGLCGDKSVGVADTEFKIEDGVAQFHLTLSDEKGYRRRDQMEVVEYLASAVMDSYGNRSLFGYKSFRIADEDEGEEEQ